MRGKRSEIIIKFAVPVAHTLGDKDMTAHALSLHALHLFDLIVEALGKVGGGKNGTPFEFLTARPAHFTLSSGVRADISDEPQTANRC